MNLFLLFYCLASTSLSPTCSCVERSAGEVYNDSKAVFVGKVIRIDTMDCLEESISKDFILKRQLIRLIRKKEYKGKAQSDTIQIMTGMGGGDCGCKFILNKNYIVYATEEEFVFKISSTPANSRETSQKNIFLSTSICDRTTWNVKAEEAQLLAFLGKKTGE